MRRRTRSQTATQRQPAQPTAMQPAISEDQRAHALNNVLDVENVAQKEESRRRLPPQFRFPPLFKILKSPRRKRRRGGANSLNQARPSAKVATAPGGTSASLVRIISSAICERSTVIHRRAPREEEEGQSQKASKLKMIL